MAAAESEVLEKELVVSTTDQALMMAISKAELDQAITTARAYPRSVKQFMSNAMELATLNEQIADECIYALPRKEKGVVKLIEGPSIRLGEIIAHAWGNNRMGARIVDDRGDFVTAQGVFHDLQTNSHWTMEVRRRITTKYGDRFSADMIGVTGNAACSIAVRNAILRGVPKAFWLPIFQEADRVCRGDAKTLANRRSEAMAYLQKFGATQDMVFALLKVRGIEDITLDHLSLLRGLVNAIKDGTTTVEEAFAAPQDEQSTTTAASTAQRAKDILRGNGTPAAQPKQDSIIPHFTTDSAITALRSCATVAKLEDAWKDIAKDFSDRKLNVPVEIEAVRNDLREALKEKL